MKRSDIREIGMSKAQKIQIGIVMPIVFFIFGSYEFYLALTIPSHLYGVFLFIVFTMFGGTGIAVAFHYGGRNKDSLGDIPQKEESK